LHQNYKQLQEVVFCSGPKHYIQYPAPTFGARPYRDGDDADERGAAGSVSDDVFVEKREARANLTNSSNSIPAI
jgi:hypothetical protein